MIFANLMNFEKIRNALTTILQNDASDNSYEVITHNADAFSSERLLNKKQVRIIVDGGKFPSEYSSYTGPQDHIVSVDLVLHAAFESSQENATIDKKIISGTTIANEQMDGFVRTIWQVISQGANIYLGLNTPTDPYAAILSSHHFRGWKKTTMQEDANVGVIRADMSYEFRTIESPQSTIGVPIAGSTISGTPTAKPKATTSNNPAFASETGTS